MGSERIWQRFCQGIQKPELQEHPDYATNGVRVRNREKLVPYLQEFFLTRSVAEWVEDLQAVRRAGAGESG